MLNNHPIHCIVPPYVLERMARSQNPDVRQSAANTLAVTARLRAQREILGPIQAILASAAPATMQRAVFDAQNRRLGVGQLPGEKVRREGEAPVADASVNEAYDGLGEAHAFYSRVFERNSIDGHGMPLVATVHYGEGYNNAFWNGQQMVFGGGDGRLFRGFTQALDVIAHELTHGVIQHLADLAYHGQSGALNESFSDVIASQVKQRAKGQTADQADWLIGDTVLAPGVNGVALRSLSAPGTAFDDPDLGRDPQPWDMDGYVQYPDDEDGDWGGVHVNSSIPSRAFYLIATKLGGNAWGDAGTIWYATLRKLRENSQFSDCARVSTQVAAALFGTGSAQHDAVKGAWETVKVRYEALATPSIAAPIAASNGAIKLAEQLALGTERLARAMESLRQIE